MSPSRRQFVLGSLSLVGCTRRDPPRPAEIAKSPPSASEAVSARPVVEIREWTMNDSPGGAARVAVIVPANGESGERFPVVIALHGRGEAVKGPDRGARGWPDDYALVHAITRIANPPITADDLQGLQDDARLAAMNETLQKQPFRGLIVACPYLPDLNLESASDMNGYARYLIESFLPRVRKETPASDAIGIDGVSLGGIMALRVGLGNPSAFNAVGALQPAIGEWQTRELTELARAAIAKRPKLKLRLLSSHEDPYLRAVKALSKSWNAANIAHEFADVPGPHDYIFNRGPGAYELLQFHDSALRS